MVNRKSLIQRLTMPLPELEAYYREQRAERFRNNQPVHGIEWRKHIHCLFLMLLKLKRIVSRQKLIVIGDKRKRADKPVIYACTHVGRYDIEMACETIRDQAWLLKGDPMDVYKKLDGLLLFVNGSVFVDTAYKEDRRIGKEACIKVLEQNGNLWIYPEGAWNITENQVVMPLFPGAADMSIRTGAEIIPIAIEQYGKYYYANVGENISPAGYDLEHKHVLTDKLRDALCTLKWEIWEQFPLVSRDSLPSDAAQQLVDGIMSETNHGYTLEVINRARYRSNTEIEPQEAFAHLNTLIPRRENAFLLREK